MECEINERMNALYKYRRVCRTCIYVWNWNMHVISSWILQFQMTVPYCSNKVAHDDVHKVIFTTISVRELWGGWQVLEFY